MADPTNQFQVTERAGICYKPLRRNCDDPRRNFERIRNKRLWAIKACEETRQKK